MKKRRWTLFWETEKRKEQGRGAERRKKARPCTDQGQNKSSI